MGTYIKIQQSITANGPYKWYWSVHQATGHLYHISQGFATYELAVVHALEHGYKYIKQLEQLGKASVQEGRAE